MRTFVALVVGLVAVVYLVNPTAGVLELIPDTMPLVGNLDEAGATALLVSVFRHFGIDISGFARPPSEKRSGRRTIHV